MENIVEGKLNLMNKLARALAKEESITDVQALARIKKEFMDRDETAETIKGMTTPRIVDFGSGNVQKCAPEDIYGVVSEQTKVELKKLELQHKQLEAEQKYQQKQLDAEQKRLDAEIKKQEYLDKKLEAEERMQKEKLDREERMQKEKLDREDKLRREEIQLQRSQKEEESKIERDRAHVEKLIMLSTLSGKKGGAPDEMMEYLKSQSESIKEFYKAQGESQKGLYDTLFKAKESERDREFEWKKELANIEAEREIEMAKLRQDDPKVASSTEVLIDTLREQFENLGTRLTKNPNDDFVAQIDQHNKFQDSLVRAAMPILKAQGLSEEQLAKVKAQVGMEEKRQEGTIEKLWDFGKILWKDYVEPAAEKASNERNAALSGLDNRVSPEIEKRIREETDAKARQIEAENKVLQLQLEEEKKRIYTFQEERKQLEYRARELVVPYDDTIHNDQLFYMIEQQEAVIEQQNASMKRETEREKRAELARRARSTMPHEVTVPEVAIPDTEVEIDEIYEVAPHEPGNADEVPDIHKPDIYEELAIPRETSQETLDFMKEREELTVESEPEAKQEEGEKPPEVEPEQPKKEKEHHTKAKRKPKPNSKFTVYKGGTVIAKVESTNHKNAGLKIANKLNGTPDSPIRISVSDDESGKSKQYDAYSAEITNKKGTKYNVPRVKVV